MLFNSIDFAIFLPIVFLLYWFVFNKRQSLQNILLLIASYVFYGWWDWRFLSLIIFSSLVDYLVGLGMLEWNSSYVRKSLLWVSIATNIGLLGFFKYYNFFLDNFVAGFSFFGMKWSPESLNIILPVGISFYTFQTLSYSIDVYNRKLEPTKNLIPFMAFVSFFPQLVAGPIERATNLLPQFYKKRIFNYSKAVEGVQQILWGLFKKIVIADTCATYVNSVFGSGENQNGSTILVASVLFAFQIYCDFSGYSDIAIGTARLFGFNLMRNFAFPYFSRDIAEFWRRWHISLSTWFRDYVYIPLGGSKGSTFNKIRNTVIVFVVSGFWHGANWTFVIWGLLNSLYFLPLLLSDRNRVNLNSVAEERIFPRPREIVSMIITFTLVVIAWIFFRANSLTQATEFITNIFSITLFSKPQIDVPFILVLFIILLVLLEWNARMDQHAMQWIQKSFSSPFRWTIYLVIFTVVIGFSHSEQDFIYFQF